MSNTTDLKELPKTKLLFQTNGSVSEHTTHALAVITLENLSEADQALLKGQKAGIDCALITESTIFHPQGGGQPSDEGLITITSNTGENQTSFKVATTRHSATNPAVVLHYGSFTPPPSADISSLGSPASKAHQQIDISKRHLYSRLHTAGHVLGAATRHLLQHEIENFDELKASHFPDSAACEFRGLIPGDQKQPIQQAVDEMLERDLPVEIEFWSKQDFEKQDLTRLIPENWTDIAVKVDKNGNEDDREDTRIRVVNIVGAEVYPCGGTHVETTKKCGKVVVRKIGRAKGETRVSYKVE